MLKIRRPLERLIFNMGIAIPGKTVFLIETAPWLSSNLNNNITHHWHCPPGRWLFYMCMGFICHSCLRLLCNNRIYNNAVYPTKYAHSLLCLIWSGFLFWYHCSFWFIHGIISSCFIGAGANDVNQILLIWSPFRYLGLLLLTWFNFNPSMDKYSHAL